jgi:hypothetical protein
MRSKCSITALLVEINENEQKQLSITYNWEIYNRVTENV